jgi:Carboxypeptidase regulatory-like domain
MRLCRLHPAFLTLLAILLAVPVHAQFAQRGSINGVVTDPSGALTADVRVTLTDLQRNQTSTTTTDSSGHYVFSQLLLGSYRLAVEASGFKKSISGPIAVSEQANVRYDFHLSIGGATETVDVTDATPLLETEHTSFAQTIDEEQVKNLPINGRNYTSLAALSPGISTTPRTNINPGGTFDVGATFSSGGVQYAAGGVSEGSRDNGYYVNGVNVNENYQSSISFQPSAEAISEVKIGVADFSAEYGRDLTNFNASTKSGSSSFHGQIYDYIENDIFNALNPFDKAQAAQSAGSTIEKNALRRNQYGAGLGGPVYIPKVLDLRKKAFFFVNYERFPQIVHFPNGFDHVPSDAFRAGDFSELCQTGFSAGICNDQDPDTGNVTDQIYNPYTTSAADPVTGLYSRQPVLNNRVDLATKPDGSPLLDPLAAGIFGLYPHANVTAAPGSTNNYEFTSVQGFTSYHFDSRFDFAISSKDNVYVTFSKYHGTNDNSGGVFPQFISNIDDKAYLITVNEAHMFSPRLTNEFIFATGTGALITVDPNELSFLNSDANSLNGIFGNSGVSSNRGILAINMFGYGTPGFNEVFRAANESLQFSDNVNWVRGRHTLTMGFNYIRKSEKDFDNVRFINIGCGAGPYCDGGRVLYSSSGTDLGSLGGDAAADLAMGLTTDIHQRFDYTNSPLSRPSPRPCFLITALM